MREVITSDWIERLLQYAQQPDVGAVGCRLSFPDGRSQHAGVAGDPIYVAYHQFKDLRGDGYYSMVIFSREVSAVTGACMMTRKELFQKMHGFDSRLKHLYNDTDFCWKLGELGYRIIYAGSVALLHHEGASRYGRINHAVVAHDTLCMLRRWRGKLLGGDPYYNHNLTNARVYLYGLTRFFYPALQGRSDGKSILLVSHNLNLEGATLGLFNIGRSLKRNGYLVVVVSPHDGNLRDAYLKHGIPVLVIPDLGHLCSIGNEDLRAFMVSFDVVVANTILMFFITAFVRGFRFGGTPKILWIIRESPRMDDFCNELRTSVEALQYAFANADKVVFLCKATRDLFSQFDSRGNFAVINDSVDWDEYLKVAETAGSHLDRDCFSVLSVGTIYPGKGQDILVDVAVDLLGKMKSNLKFYFAGKIGDRAFYDMLERRISEHQMGDRIVFLGELSRRDIISAYTECSAFVLPSRRESFPTAVLEAMAAGKPIIATRTFGVPEQIKHEYSGLLVEPNDRSSLRESILRIYNDAAFAARLGENARTEFVQRFTLDIMSEKYQELVRNLMRERGERRGHGVLSSVEGNLSDSVDLQKARSAHDRVTCGNRGKAG